VSRTLQLAALAGFWSLVSGCAAAPAEPPALAGSHWHLAAASGGVLQSHARDSKVTLVFEPDRLGGYGGCNTYSGEYTLVGRELRIGVLTRTKRGCADTAGEIEAAWHAALAETLRVEQQASQLILTTAGGLELRFEPDASGAGEP
jgi:heat shock protein HslJ